MSWFTRGVAALLLALWVPAMLHCRLELVSGLKLLSCCQHPDSESVPAHHEHDCDDDGCAALESGLYEQDKPAEAPAQPPSPRTALLRPWLVAHLARPWVPMTSPAWIPPAPPPPWQFAHRTALPPRAPSLAS